MSASSNYSVQLVNEQKYNSHSRIRELPTGSNAGCNTYSRTSRCINISHAFECAGLSVQGSWVLQASLLKGVLQRPLHSRQEWSATGYPRKSPEARRLLRAVWRGNWRKGWMGALPEALPKSPLRNNEGCCHQSIWGNLRSLRRAVSQSCIRLSSLLRQDWITKQYDFDGIADKLGKGVVQMHFALRKLSQIGA